MKKISRNTRCCLKAAEQLVENPSAGRHPELLPYDDQNLRFSIFSTLFMTVAAGAVALYRVYEAFLDGLIDNVCFCIFFMWPLQMVNRIFFS